MIRKNSVAQLIRELNETDESEQLEAKDASESVGKAVYETICALSNEPDLGGGTLLLGVSKEVSLFPYYSPSGVKDPDKVASDVASACGTIFNQPVRVDITPEQVDGAVILKVDVPELLASQKPLYIKAQGLPRGAFRRVGPTDVRCTDEDLLTFFHGKGNDSYDARLVKEARWDDIDPNAVAAYRKARAELNPLAEELNWSDEEMLFSLGALKRVDDRVRVTATGLLTFGKASSLRRLLPSERVDYIRVPGTIWVNDPEAHLESLDMRGPIISLIGRVIAAISDDLPRTLNIGESRTGQRSETQVVPLRVIREAVVNALMHRSYQSHRPIQVIRYANRIVIKNPGYSLKSQDRFEDPGSFMRNPHIAEILHETRFAETKGSGIRVMQEKMLQSGLAAPTFESDRDNDEFIATFLFHHFLDESDWEWLAGFSDLKLSEDQMKALIFVREVGAIDNSTYRSLTKTDTLAASRSLRDLRKSELLSDRGSGARTYYVAGSEMERRAGRPRKRAPTIHDMADVMDGAIHDIEIPIADLPTKLRMLVRASHMKTRLSPAEAKNLVLRLCEWKPLAISEIAGLLKRTPAYVSQRYVTPLIGDGVLAYIFPEMPQHPAQKYRTVDRSNPPSGS